jgi:hypothetical protein
MARFYSNESIPIQVLTELRRVGHDVLTSADADVLAFAIAQGQILLSHNRRHFLTLHRRRNQDHP